MAIAPGQRPVVDGVLDWSVLEAVRSRRMEVWSLLDDLDRIVPAATGEQRGPEATERLAVALASLALRLEVSAIELGSLQPSPVSLSMLFAAAGVDVGGYRSSEGVSNAAE